MFEFRGVLIDENEDGEYRELDAKKKKSHEQDNQIIKN